MGDGLGPLATLPEAHRQCKLRAHEWPGFEPSPERARELIELSAKRFAARVHSRPVEFKLAVRALSVTRSIKVRVVDEDGYGVSGIKVNVYNGPVIRTDEKGYAAISCESSDVSIYVNGFTSYSGSVSMSEPARSEQKRPARRLTERSARRCFIPPVEIDGALAHLRQVMEAA